MLKYAKSPKRSTTNISDSSQFGYNGYYRAAEKVDDLETLKNVHTPDAKNSFVNLTDIEEDLEGISVSSLSNLSEFSIDWSEHNKTAKAVWIRRTDLTSDLNKAKERIKAREAEKLKLSLCNKSKLNLLGNDQKKEKDSEHPTEINAVEQKYAGVNGDSSSTSSSSSSGYSQSSSSKQNNVPKRNLSNNNIDKLKAVSVDVDNPSKGNKGKYEFIKRNSLVISGFVLMFILIIALIILAAKMGQVQETVKYIEDIFVDNVTFAET